MDSTAANKTFIEFFAGIGLVHEGLKHSGWRCTYANDHDPHKAAMYRAQFGETSYYHEEDVWRTDAVLERIVEAPLLATASFPCTDMSLAGRMQGFQGQESSAFFGFTAVLDRLGERRPPLVMLENVCGFLSSHDGADFLRAVETLADLGYWVDAMVLDARDFVPQSRTRLFVLGYHESLPSERLLRQDRNAGLLDDRWLAEISSSERLRPARLRRAMETIELPTGWATIPLSPPKKCRYELTDYLDLDDDQEWWDEPLVQKHYGMMSNKHRREVDRRLASGQPWAATIYRRVRQGQQRAEVRLDGVAGCLRTPRGGSARQIVAAGDHHRLRMRWMSPREYARLQGAAEFVIDNSTSRALFGFGDAVCTPVISWIDREVLSPLAEVALSSAAARVPLAERVPLAACPPVPGDVQSKNTGGQAARATRNRL